MKLSKISRSRLRLLLIALASGAFVACGGGNDEGQSTDGGAGAKGPIKTGPDSGPSINRDSGTASGPDAARGADASSTSDDCPVASQLDTRVSSSDVHRGKDDNGVFFFTWNLTLHEAPLHVVRILLNEPVQVDTPLELAKACSTGTEYCALLQVNAVRGAGSAGAVGSQITLKPTSGTVTVSLANVKNFKAKVTASHWADPTNPAGCTVDLPGFDIDLPVQ